LLYKTSSGVTPIPPQFHLQNRRRPHQRRKLRAAPHPLRRRNLVEYSRKTLEEMWTAVRIILRPYEISTRRLEMAAVMAHTMLHQDFMGRKQFEADTPSRQASSNRADYLSTLDGASSNGMNLRSNLEEYVQRTNSQRNSQRSQYASRLEFNDTDIFSERGVDIGSTENNIQPMLPKSYSEWRHCLIAGSPVNRSGSLKVTSLEQEAGRPEDSGISSYRSITEIYHAAETAEQGKPEEARKGELIVEHRDVSSIEVLEKCVLPIRGFGARKLTEQELGRWRQLLVRDATSALSDE
ncbi:hypothetical protein COOONC_24745, partial [Cooperia oncophora]